MHQQVLRVGRRIIIAVGGMLVVAVGVLLAMPLVPGPGIPLILVGLGILSLEFERPRLWLARIKAMVLPLRQRFSERRSRSSDGQ